MARAVPVSYRPKPSYFKHSFLVERRTLLFQLNSNTAVLWLYYYRLCT